MYVFPVSIQLGPNVSIGTGVTIGAGVRVRESIILHGATLQVSRCENSLLTCCITVFLGQEVARIDNAVFN